MDHTRTKTAQINLRIKPELKAAAEKAAAADHRSLTSLVEKLLADYCEKLGIPIESPAKPAPKRGRTK